MSILKRIAERTSTKKHIDVPEWGEKGTPVKVYYGPLLAGELNRIQRNGQGEKLFTLEDKAGLMREEVGIIATVAGALMTGTSVEEAEKN